MKTPQSSCQAKPVVAAVTYRSGVTFGETWPTSTSPIPIVGEITAAANFAIQATDP